MPAGRNVNPKKWKNLLLLYDDREYSAVWGYYDNSPRRRLGVRWNDNPAPLGYPKQSKYPLWYVEPDWLARTILLELQKIVKKNPPKGTLVNILTALSES
jgi:hypothetical protein